MLMYFTSLTCGDDAYVEGRGLLVGIALPLSPHRTKEMSSNHA